MKKTLALLAILSMAPSAHGAIILLGGFDGNQTENNAGDPKTLSDPVQDPTAVGNISVSLSTPNVGGLTGFDWAFGFQSSHPNWGTQSFLPAASTANNNAVYASDTPSVHHTISMIITNTGTSDITLNSLHMRIKRDGTNSPDGLLVSYAGGDLTGGSAPFALDGSLVDFYDFSLAGVLTDNTLAASESATINWVTTGGSGQRIRFDNIAISGELVPEPSSLTLLGLGLGGLLLRRRRH